MSTFAVISMGEMGAAVAGRLVSRGARVLTDLEGRSQTSAERARDAGVVVATPQQIVEEAEIILSIIPPAAAPALAKVYLPFLKDAATPPLFLDCNAIAPTTTREMDVPFLNNGLPFGDASIIGGPPKGDGAGPRLYMSGPVADAAATLKAHGIDTRLMSDTIGDASAIKMSYAGITKGFQALASAMANGAGRNGVLEPLIEELNFSQDAIYGWAARQLPAMPGKAYRWDGEMREIARFLSPEKGSSQMLDGAAELYARIANAKESGDDSELLERIARFADR